MKRKQALKDELRQKSLAGMTKHAKEKDAAADGEDGDQIGSSVEH